MMKPVELGELPVGLVEAIHRDKFLYAWFLPDRGVYIARHVRPDGRAEEIEYDVALGRPLTLDERRRALPPEARTALPEEGVTVASRYFLDDETAKLTVILDVIDEAGTARSSVRRQVYAPVIPWDFAAAVQDAVKQHRFPVEYAAWPVAQKISFWAVKLHRWRRAHGESGWDEDEIYTPELVRDMEWLDPHVRDLLPDILALVGRLEQTEPSEAIAAFAARTNAIEPRRRHVEWKRSNTAEFPFEADVDGHRWRLRVNDFPAEPFYTLMIDDAEIESFDSSETPAIWKLPR